MCVCADLEDLLGGALAVLDARGLGSRGRVLGQRACGLHRRWRVRVWVSEKQKEGCVLQQRKREREKGEKTVT